jgi:hypothetical protein
MSGKNSLIISITLIAVTSFSINILYRLKQASKEYPSDFAFEDATHITSEYVKFGLIMMTCILFFSFYILFKELNILS